MTTSNTIDSTVIDVTTTIERSCQMCGIEVTTLNADNLQAARDNLFLILTALSNQGINLWCIQKTPLAMVVNQATINLPVGTIDVLRANYRTLTTPSNSPLSGATWAGVDFGATITHPVSIVGFTPSITGQLNLVIENSPDGVTWVTVKTLPILSAVAGTQYWFDIDNTTTAEYWRVRETVAVSMVFTTTTFGTTPAEIPMAPLSLDNYATLPNKTFTGKPLQYWFDKQKYQPVLWLWPVPNDTAAQIVVWTHRQIQDVGALTNTLDIPNRWLDSIQASLAYRMAFILPKVDPNLRQELKALSGEYTLSAANGEANGAPIMMLPRIGAYTK